MELSAKKEQGVVVMSVKGRMDAVTAPEFEKGFDPYITGGDRKFVADLADLEYISSAGLRSILSTAKKVKAVGGQVVFACLSGMVKEVFDISGFGSMFEIYASVKEAVSKL